MKKLLLVSTLFISLVANSQVTNNTPWMRWTGRQWFDQIRPRTDTAITPSNADTGMIATIGSTVYVWSKVSSQYKWVGISGSGGSGGGENLLQTMRIGNTTTLPIVWDSVRERPGHNTGFDVRIMTIKPLDTADGNVTFNYGLSTTGGTAGITPPTPLHSNNVLYRGWNVNNVGGVETVGYPMLAEGMESRWRPDTTIDYTEWHQVYGDVLGGLHRISSYTIDNGTKDVAFYQTVGNWSLKKASDDSVFYGIIPGGFAFTRMTSNVNFSLTGTEVGFDKTGPNVGNQFYIRNFTSSNIPYALTLDGGASHSGSNIVFTGTSGATVASITAGSGSTALSLNTPTASGRQISFEPNNTSTAMIWPDRNVFSQPLFLNDDPTAAAPSRRFEVNSGSFAASARISNNTSGANTYGLQIVTSGSATEANALYVQGTNNSGNSGNKLINFPSTVVSNATNWVIYSQSAAKSVWAGWSRFGDNALGDPRESVDAKGKIAVDSLDTDGGSNSLVTWDNTTHRLEKRASPEASATLDFGSTAANTVTDLTITVTGAASGDIVTLGVPNGSVPAGGTFFAWVSATNTVTVRFANNTTGALDPASGTFKVKLIQ